MEDIDEAIKDLQWKMFCICLKCNAWNHGVQVPDDVLGYLGCLAQIVKETTFEQQTLSSCKILLSTEAAQCILTGIHTT